MNYSVHIALANIKSLISAHTYFPPLEWPCWFPVEDCTHLVHPRDLDAANIPRRGLLLQQRGQLEGSTVQALTGRKGNQIELTRCITTTETVD